MSKLHLRISIIITVFVRLSVAAALLAQSTAKISGLTLRISDPQSASVDPVIPVSPDLNRSLNPADAEQLHSDTLQVHASPSLPSEDVLMTYFESRRVSGGAIKKLTIHDDGQSATIVFKDPKGMQVSAGSLLQTYMIYGYFLQRLDQWTLKMTYTVGL